MPDVWRVVPLAAATPPAPTTEARARRWWRNLLARWRGAIVDVDDPTPEEDHLEALDAARLERLVPKPPRDAQRAALAAWRDARPHGLVLRPDDGAWDEALDDAGEGGPAVVRPPDGAVVHRALPEDLIEVLEGEDEVHLARLEGWWVRHHDGLDALRDLFARLGDRRGPWSADVAPWAWAWMRRTLPEARGLPTPFMPAPLDGPALQGWLGADPALRLRGSGEAPGEPTFRALAARARGEAGVAAAVWTAAMRDGRERTAEDGDEDAPDDDLHVWLRDPASVALPSAASLPRDDVLLLHAVLLHGVAPAAVVGAAVARGAAEAGVALRVLRMQGLLELVGDGRYRVAPAALPSLWSRLESEAIAGVRG